MVLIVQVVDQTQEQGWADYFRIGVQTVLVQVFNKWLDLFQQLIVEQTLAVTITNNTGQDYAMLDYNNTTMGQRIPFNSNGTRC